MKRNRIWLATLTVALALTVWTAMGATQAKDSGALSIAREGYRSSWSTVVASRERTSRERQTGEKAGRSSFFDKGTLSTLSISLDSGSTRCCQTRERRDETGRLKAAHPAMQPPIGAHRLSWTNSEARATRWLRCGEGVGWSERTSWSSRFWS
jgi:hypothetical protein